MSIQGTRNGVTRIRCSRAVESGTCGNRRTYVLQKIERAVIDHVAAQLAQPDLIKAYVSAYREERMRDAAEAQRGRTSLERRHRQLEGQIGRMLDLYAKGTLSEELFTARAMPLQDEWRSLGEQLAHLPVAPVIELHPQAVTQYEELVDDLATRMATLDVAADRSAIDRFRALIDHVKVIDAPDGGIIVDVVGRLSALVGRDAGDCGGSLVAEDRLSLSHTIPFGKRIAA